MRHALLLLVPASFGCAEACPTAAGSLNTSLWHVFDNITDVEDGQLDSAFPAYSSPGNGNHDMIVKWTQNADRSPVLVNMDGQEFAGEGIWDDADCGNFFLKFTGDYYGDDGSKHAFVASGNMQTWPGYLQGIWDLHEVWTATDGTKGDDQLVVQVFGTL